MPKLKDNQVPAYRLHKQSGRAVVTLNGRDICLGVHDTPGSREKYNRVIAEWLANGRRLPAPAQALNVAMLILAFWKHAQTHYRDPDGKPTSELDNFRDVLNAPGTNRTRRPRKAPGPRYSVESYCKAIYAGCARAFPLPPELARGKVDGKKGTRWETPAEWRTRLGDRWAEAERWVETHRFHPHQLRHNAATRLRKQYGLEAARVVLGHRSAAVAEVYAEVDLTKAAQIMAEVG